MRFFGRFIYSGNDGFALRKRFTGQICNRQGNWKGLIELWIFDNSIEDLTPLAGCKYMEYVDVSNNLITDLTPLAEKKLIVLKASNNLLDGNYFAITGLTIYDELYLDGNGYDADPDGFYIFTGEIVGDRNGFNYCI